jgi:hypothetical protein
MHIGVAIKIQSVPIESDPVLPDGENLLLAMNFGDADSILPDPDGTTGEVDLALLLSAFEWEA